ncbi:DEAD/DEAH box helicase family protein (plasmid) [Rhodococcus qingshengii]|uniref:restriction endonuclease n=1 Tax=Rhodococcus TaxID=1827 RepID=UPI000F626F3D|nr:MULTISPECIES: DEAD/DEAH box helicase family protein [Rhodococcus]AZI65368.1 Type III site-specific deoxyribonuclease [Rhodococcus sp. NJ-530]MBS2993028.1 DEAD/DEAH box helicase family protein [Rhodococcus erythropolis]BDQ24204.1 DEAD/DEAH box helicase family protein [Rhodococcus qingshengii]
MKFRFEDQPHQAAAIAAVTDLFEGALRPPADTLVGQAPGSASHAGFTVDPELLADNLAAITEREKVDKQTSLALLEVDDLRGQERSFPNFSVEMETGTGKTYVYIATALRLAELYGLRKFVILVHSVAIRAGAVKTFEQTAEHFGAKFPSVKYRWGVLGEGPALDDFTEPSGTVQFIIASVQAIDKPDTNSVYQQAEQPQLWSDSMSDIASIAAARPVVIIDEPQNMTTDLRRRAIATLNPLAALRYSATHREVFNLVHRLGPKAASEAGLVKRVSVKGIVAGDTDKPYLMVKKLRSVRKRIMADVVIEQATKDGFKRVDVVLQNGSDLFEESGGRNVYQGMVVDRFERKPDRIFFEGGRELRTGQEIGVDRTAIWRDQIRHTIRQHLAREAQIDATGREVKVLSLFFVEHVADYVPVAKQPDPIVPAMFDALFREEWAWAGRPEDNCPDPETLRVHYFPSTKTGIYKDTKGNASDAEFEARAYEEIIANKELILTKDNPRAFIFSHSALKEGWDNPNVFQVGFLRHTRSDLERRQQIGRGLRLPVDVSGRRVADPATCRLTLVVDESFAEFRDGLNQEYVASGGNGDGGGPEPDDADQEVIVRRRNDKFASSEFAQLWRRIRYKARYRVALDPSVLPDAIARSEHLEPIADLARRANVVQAADLVYDDAGKAITSDAVVSQDKGELLTIVGHRLPDLVRLVEDQLLATKYPLQLTRPTVCSILAALPFKVQRRAIDDPERWARLVAVAIRTVTIEEMVKHIGYEPVPEEDWWDAEVVFVEAETTNPPASTVDIDPSYGVIAAPAGGSNLFDHTIYDSHVERNFSGLLENDSEHVKLFTKLPRRFRVRTPVGDYSPDWAIVYDEDGVQRLYLVRETKDTLNLDDLDWNEAMRIRFAQKHFAAAPEGPVDYRHTDDLHGIRPPSKIDQSGT